MNVETLIADFTRLLNEKDEVQIEIVDYTEKSIAVFGNTFLIKEKLKELGGKYNANLKKGEEKVPGWILTKSKKNEVSKIIGELDTSKISLFEAKKLLDKIYASHE